MANLLWLQGGACSGNTMSFLNAEEPSVCDFVTDFGINILWHPSLGMELGENLQKLPCLGCTEPEFPFHELAPGTVFKTQTVMGVPKSTPAGIDRMAYVKFAATAKTVAPRWAEDDIFVV
jgi:Ni,Fe-hydrogenase I small subunit